MKYIKKFNESSSEYYEEIENTYLIYDFFKDAAGVFGNTIDIKKVYFDEIKQGLKTDDYQIEKYGNFIRITSREWSNFKSYYEIGQDNDEWFYVRVGIADWISSGDVYYKCDQFEGLIEFLKNMNLII
jgi:hypothetical protein